MNRQALGMNFLPLLFLLAVPESQAAAKPAYPGRADFPAFAPHSLQDSSEELGWFRETLSLADVDGDGDLDFFSGQGRGAKEYWFENRGQKKWLHHLVSDSNDADVGAAVADVDGDGDLDRLAGGFLYLHPGPGKTTPFVTLRTGAPAYTHDLLVGDIDKDGRTDFVTIDFPGIQWYRNPGAPYTDWPMTQVSGPDSISQHGGLALGDFDGDGDLDISRVDCWFENQDGGKTWRRRFGPDFGVSDSRASWGLSARTVAEDIDGDGDVDLAQAESDVKNGRVAWFENRYLGDVWIPHLVKDSVDGQDFHSLILADFDGDGDKDFFSCGSGGSVGAKHWYVWENLDGRGWTFQEHVIWKDAARSGHESVAFDMDGDGDLDILSKEMAGNHVWLENLRINGGPGGISQPRRPAVKRHPRARWNGLGPVLLQPSGDPSNLRDGLGRSHGSYFWRLPREDGN